MPPDIEKHLVTHWLCNDEHAIELIRMWFEVSQTWDDLIDKDQTTDVPDYSINRMMRLALCEIPKNRFFQYHCNELLPMVSHCVQTWMEATALERSPYSNERDYAVSYIIRSVTTELLVFMAGLVGGASHRHQVAMDIRRAIYRDNESFEAYCQEIRDQHPRDGIEE